METNTLIYILLGLLFAKDPLYAFLEKKFGFQLKGKNTIEELGDFHLKIARELGGINEKLNEIPEIKTEVRRLANHVSVQNGRIGKLENK